MTQKDIAIKAEIKTQFGSPKLFINDKLFNTDSYLTYLDENNDYEAFSKDGFKVFSTSVFFHSRIINESTGLESFSQGVLDNKKNLKIIDKKINVILKNNPNAYIFPRINIELSKKWEDNHQEELNNNILNTENKRACLSSHLWLKQVKKEIKKVINYIQNQDYAKQIIGYQIAGAMTEEWMAMDFNGSQGKRSEEFFKKKIKEGKYKNTENEYHRFLNDVVADDICKLARFIKKITDRRLIVGSFYGYSFLHMSWEFTHSSLHKILKCKDIDFLCSPLAYWTERKVGVPCPYMVPVGSIQGNGKLYFAENDTRTDLSKYFSNNINYQAPIWKGPERYYSLEMLKYHYGKALCHNTAYWWFDLWGGWYKHEDFHNLFKKLISISQAAVNTNSHSLKNVAVIIDENAAFENNKSNPNLSNIGVKPLKIIESSGISFDMYLASDFNIFKNKYKAYILLETRKTNLLEKIKNYFNKRKTNYLLINENTCDITTSKLREFYKNSKINLKFDFDIVVDENTHYISLYILEDKEIVNFSDNVLVDLLTNKEVIFPIKAKKGQCYLLKKI